MTSTTPFLSQIKLDKPLPGPLPKTCYSKHPAVNYTSSTPDPSATSTKRSFTTKINSEIIQTLEE